MAAKKSFSRQLSDITGRPEPRNPAVEHRGRYGYQNSEFRACTRWQGDNIDHVNISPKAKTELGRVLMPSFNLPFTHDVFGNLNSISGLWHDLDTYVGERVISKQDIELHFMLADGMWQRLQQYPTLADQLKAETRPFDMYEFNAIDFASRNSIAFWWLEVIHRCRLALQNGSKYPDFRSLIKNGTHQRTRILSEFLNKYIPNRRHAEIAPEGQIDGIEQDPTAPVAEPAPSLIKTLRTTPPAVGNFKRFDMTLKPKTGKALERKPKPEPAGPAEPAFTWTEAMTPGHVLARAIARINVGQATQEEAMNEARLIWKKHFPEFYQKVQEADAENRVIIHDDIAISAPGLGQAAASKKIAAEILAADKAEIQLPNGESVTFRAPTAGELDTVSEKLSQHANVAGWVPTVDDLNPTPAAVEARLPKRDLLLDENARNPGEPQPTLNLEKGGQMYYAPSDVVAVVDLNPTSSAEFSVNPTAESGDLTGFKFTAPLDLNQQLDPSTPVPDYTAEVKADDNGKATALQSFMDLAFLKLSMGKVSPEAVFDALVKDVKQLLGDEHGDRIFGDGEIQADEMMVARSLDDLVEAFNERNEMGASTDQEENEPEDEKPLLTDEEQTTVDAILDSDKTNDEKGKELTDYLLTLPEVLEITEGNDITFNSNNDVKFVVTNEKIDGVFRLTYTVA